MTSSVGRGAHRPVWAGTLMLGSGVVVYDGPGASAGRHRHDAIQLVVGVDAPVVLRTDDGDRRATAALVPSRVEHSLVATGRTLLVLVEPAGSVGAAVSRVAASNRGSDLSGRLADLPAPPIADPDSTVAWSRRALEQLTGVSCAVGNAAVRPEVLALVRYVDERLDGSRASRRSRPGSRGHHDICVASSTLRSGCRSVASCSGGDSGAP